MTADDEAVAKRRWATEQAIANCKIEGFEPSAEFLEQCERFIRGEITSDESIAQTLAKYQVITVVPSAQE